MKLGDTVAYSRHKEDDYIDEVRIIVRERYKMSGMSGDEWRFHRVIQLYRKGHLIGEQPYNGTIQAVASFLPWTMTEIGESGKMTIIDDKDLCFQPGCPNVAVSEYEIIEEFGPQGQRLHPDETGHWAMRRKFCAKHLRRGDCGREDSDRNYRVISGPGPDGADMREAPISESRRVDVRVASIEELPQAIENALKADRRDSN